MDPHAWRLEVGGLVERPMRLSLDDLAAFPRSEVPATLICAGLRRDEYLSIGPLPGELPWGPEPISTGCWSGFVLANVLRQAGLSPEARFVEFVGLDSVERHGQRFGFGGSIDLAKALSPDVLLATELNGGPLPPDHGFPLRALVPGWIGARSVKWLGRITVTAAPSQNYFQTKAYRMPAGDQPSRPARRLRRYGAERGAAQCGHPGADPGPGRRRGAGDHTGMGDRLGGRRLTAVEVSPNAGAEWQPARIAVPGSPWTWSLWEATLDLTRGRHMLAVRASDTSGVIQPAAVWDTWNVKGYANNAWHRVPVQAE